MFLKLQKLMQDGWTVYDLSQKGWVVEYMYVNTCMQELFIML